MYLFAELQKFMNLTIMLDSHFLLATTHSFLLLRKLFCKEFFRRFLLHPSAQQPKMLKPLNSKAADPILNH